MRVCWRLSEMHQTSTDFFFSLFSPSPCFTPGVGRKEKKKREGHRVWSPPKGSRDAASKQEEQTASKSGPMNREKKNGKRKKRQGKREKRSQTVARLCPLPFFSAFACDTCGPTACHFSFCLRMDNRIGYISQSRKETSLQDADKVRGETRPGGCLRLFPPARGHLFFFVARQDGRFTVEPLWLRVVCIALRSNAVGSFSRNTRRQCNRKKKKEL